MDEMLEYKKYVFMVEYTKYVIILKIKTENREIRIIIKF